MAYGIAEGLDEADVRRIANPKVIKLLRKAMLYDKGEKVVTKKGNQTPTRVKKTGGREALETVPSNSSEEHTCELQSLLRSSYAVYCLKKNKMNRRRNSERN